MDFPPPRIPSADVCVLPRPASAREAAPACSGQSTKWPLPQRGVMGGTDLLERVRTTVSFQANDNGAPGLEDKPPVSPAATWVEASSFIKRSASDIMDKLEKRVFAMATAGRRPVVIFDLDSTLYNNGPRQEQIAHAFAAAYKDDKVFGAEAAKLASFKGADTTFSNEHAVQSCGVDTKTEVGKKVLDAYVAFWRARFFDNAYVPFDAAYANAVEQVQRIFHATDKLPEAQRVHIVYLTGRHKAFATEDPAQRPYSAGMEIGTRQALERDGLPIDPSRVTLMMKDSFTEKDSDFKGRVKSEVNALGQVVGAFDNEPWNIAVFVRDYPQAMHVFVYTIASDKPAQPVRNVFKFGDGANDNANWPPIKQAKRSSY